MDKKEIENELFIIIKNLSLENNKLLLAFAKGLMKNVSNIEKEKK